MVKSGLFMMVSVLCTKVWSRSSTKVLSERRGSTIKIKKINKQQGSPIYIHWRRRFTFPLELWQKWQFNEGSLWGHWAQEFCRVLHKNQSMLSIYVFLKIVWVLCLKCENSWRVSCWCKCKFQLSKYVQLTLIEKPINSEHDQYWDISQSKIRIGNLGQLEELGDSRLSLAPHYLKTFCNRNIWGRNILKMTF